MNLLGRAARGIRNVAGRIRNAVGAGAGRSSNT